MALWKETPTRAPAPSGAAASANTVTELNKASAPATAPDSDATRRMPSTGSAPTASAGETVIAAGLTMEGKIASGGDVQRLGGRYICDRGSTHLRYQMRLLAEEYDRAGIALEPVHPRNSVENFGIVGPAQSDAEAKKRKVIHRVFPPALCSKSR